MKKPDTQFINQPWPEEGLEYVEKCPYCNSTERTLAYKDVQDWSFYCAPGKWNYWDCKLCSAIYLDPRPTKETIGMAYGAYYTHSAGNKKSISKLFKVRLINEWRSHLLNTNISPRLHIPQWLGWLLIPLKSRLVELFGQRELLDMPKGRLMDVGCGDGDMLNFATKLGWQVTGLEIDPAAVISARTQGLDVIEGTYEKLTEYRQMFDCIVCSHVLEHVHNPLWMLSLLKAALKPGGVLLLSLPNATSELRYYFGENWRGLETPRHLSIPAMTSLKAKLTDMGFCVSQRKMNSYLTAVESSRIQRRAAKINAYDRRLKEILSSKIGALSDQQEDFIHFICVNHDQVAQTTLV